MKQLILVFIGGGFGSVFRYLLSKYFNSEYSGIPLGTFIANVLGSLLIGVVLGLAAKNQTLTQNQTLLLATGFCGGFTTFSTFANENQIFIKNGDFLIFGFYTVLSFAFAISAVFLGIYFARFFA